MARLMPLRAAPLSVTMHPLFNAATHLATLTPQMNPILNPAAPLPQGATQAMVSQIANTPALASLATGATVAPAGTGSAATSVATSGGAFDPTTFTRMPSRRHMLLGCAAVTVVANNGSYAASFIPQVDVKPNHLMIPSNQTWLSGLQNVLVGAFPQSVSPNQDDPEEFWETSLGGMWDLDECQVGLSITMNFIGGASAASQATYAVLTCEAADQKPYSLPRSALKRVGVGSTSIAGGATTTIGGQLGITPQVGFKPRKVMLSANVAGLVINQWTIGINPCFASKDPVPAMALSTFAQFLWFDLDEARVGNGIFFTVYNPTTAAIIFSGGMLGDVNPGDISAQGGR